MKNIDELIIDNNQFILSKCSTKSRIDNLNNPKLVSFNKDVCDLINLESKNLNQKDLIKIINGNTLIKNSTPYSTAYCGHQFGHFVPYLGDGRAINLGNIKGYELQLKGSVITSYSRFGDGKAVQDIY